MRRESADYIGARSCQAAKKPDIKLQPTRQCQNNGCLANGMRSYKLHEVTAALEMVIKSELDDETRGAALKCVLRAQFSAVEKLFSIFKSN